MAPIIIYHNPRCSKSREALKILEEKQIAFEVREYLKEPPSVDEIRGLLKKLKLPIKDIIRTGEDEYTKHDLDQASDDDLIGAIAEYPILLQRPIVVHGQKAVIGRPASQIDLIL
ncbi:MAG: arsenate reductase (glutaredoxin) [Verrucomicrobiota bacterium]|nr:arsenate reductase (glutaredoxin) [Verrucomicrobiota bacterium]